MDERIDYRAKAKEDLRKFSADMIPEIVKRSPWERAMLHQLMEETWKLQEAGTGWPDYKEENLSKTPSPTPLAMSSPNQAGGPGEEAHYELPSLTETFDAVRKAERRSSGSIQQTLEILAQQGYYLVRRRTRENQTPENN
jgi:hypothetical protein